jgi:hypothetical protein
LVVPFGSLLHSLHTSIPVISYRIPRNHPVLWAIIVSMNRVFGLLAVLLLATCITEARVDRVEIAWSGSVLNGKSFGKAGAYEAMRGTIHFLVDPDDSANENIADLHLAPKNNDDEVAFSADFYLFWPIDASKSNGTVLMDVANRGNKLMLDFFNGATRAADPTLPEHFGDGFLLEQGFALLWVGWQFDVPDREGLVRVHVPVARNVDGTPLSGLVRSEIIVPDRVFDYSLGDRDHKAYSVSDIYSEQNVLTVRDSPTAPRTVIPRERWKFARMENGKLVEDRTRVYLEGGFEPHRIYDLVYVAENPPVAGLGLAALRDAASYMKHAEGQLFGVQDYRFERVIGFGVSQSGRLLRTLLYYGLNEDEEGHRAFDGIIAHVAGGGRGSFNQRFAQPSRDGHPFSKLLYPTDIYPFSDLAQKDPETGREEGILSRLLETDTATPKIFYTNSSYEYWGRAASLIHTTLDGRKDLDPPANTRIYMFAGTQHGVGPWPPRPTGTLHAANNHDYIAPLRALLLAMDRWLRDGTEPPPSQYPRLKGNQLVPPTKLRWPKIPGAPLLTGIQKAYRVDYGPRFVKDGIVDEEPPKVGKVFPTFVSQVDADGNEVAGIRLPEVAVPLATYTGWNPFDGKSGPSNQIASMVGSFIPFPRTKEEARASGDPRKPIDARYKDRDDFLRRVDQSIENLVREGYLLQSDAGTVRNRMATVWDWVMSQPPAVQAGN